MTHLMEVLLADDNSRDAEMTIEALKNNMPNKLLHLKDITTALNFLFAV